MLEAEQIGANLRDWRIILGLPQELVAERANISRSTLIKLERGAGSQTRNLPERRQGAGHRRTPRRIHRPAQHSSYLGSARASDVSRQPA